jgi:fatty-acyl-CoA synthase
MLSSALPAHVATTTTLAPLFEALRGFGDRPAIRFGGDTWTYQRLVDEADRLARGLIGLGVGPGVPVALMMSNRPEYLVADLAVIRCGAIKVPLNDMLSQGEIAHILADSGAAVAIADRGLLPAAQQAVTGTLHTLITVDSLEETPPGTTPWRTVLQDGDDRNATPRTAASTDPAAPDDLGLILYTGGTTGRPKGVTHTQRGLAVNLLSHIIEAGIGDDERILLTSPLPHSAGFLAQAGLLRGATLLLERRFDPDQVLGLIAGGTITFTFMVPTMIYRLLDRAAGRDLSASALRTILYGAAPITRERLAQGLATFGPVFMQLYGQSEAPNFLTRLRREDHTTDPALAHRLTSCGRAVLLATVAVVDDEGHPLPPGEVGEVVARSPYVMAGYHRLPDKTAETLRDGWLHTGDIGYLAADGYLYLLDRKNDIIITGGMNVYSSEVEQFLQTCPGVGQVAVVGLPDPDWGEAVVAVVVPAPGTARIDLDDLTARCRLTLSAYKRPKSIRQVEQLPLTPYGKVDKKQLRNQLTRDPESPR